MLAHPDFLKPFDVHAISSAYQLGGVVCQGGKYIEFCSKKLNSAQKNYPITEKELLSIVKPLKNSSIYCSVIELQFTPIIEI